MPDDAKQTVQEALQQKRQQLRMRRFGMAVLSAFVTYATLSILQFHGLVDSTALTRSAVFTALVMTGFFIAFHTGINLKAKDPSLTAAQILMAEMVILLLLHGSEGARSAISAYLTVPLLFGIYRFSTRKLMKMAIAVIALYAMMVLFLWLDGLDGTGLAVEIGRLSVVATVLILIAFVGGHISLLRSRLHDSKVFFETIWDTCTDAVVVTDADGRVIYANPSLWTVFGYNPQHLVGSHVSRLQPNGIGPDASLAHAMNALGPGNDKVIREIEALHAGGAHFPVEITLGHARMNGRDIRVAFLSDITERKAAENQIRHLAHHDPLTGLPNRMTLQERLEHAIAHARRKPQDLWVLFLDVDRFKLINDSLGHRCGDLVLTTIAARLMECCRDTDTVARLGGDEFVVLLEGTPSAELSVVAVERIMDALARPMFVDGHELALTPSIGIAVYPQDGDTPDQLVERADAAMYRAKQSGRNNFCFYTTSMNDVALSRLQMENDLRNALAAGEFLLHYQPQFDVGSGALSGVEALLRWHHPRDGITSPAEFIPIAEETGLIVPIGEWVIRAACEQQRAWAQAGLPPLRISVNLSQRQFTQSDLVDTIARILQETNAVPQLLEFEITESTLMGDVDHAVRQLRQLRALGVHLSIDDFGTGYSSLAFLKRFPIEILKIDRSFVHDMQQDSDAREIVHAIVSLAKTLRLEVVAEGVEDAAQLRVLREMQCDRVQGFLLGRPVEARQIAELAAPETEKMQSSKIKVFAL
ncbi:putative bifunctional diguanylate cyclase/phosphodiesterase [Noviherbaspirillum sp. ST9]|uniref:putative bifunctional diguanylate cyclase/phosphodiesterase n=1 Tax=Noviherbaspirillum sp. ST9 TaxID=3401606 RepID=UPI003B5899D8